MKDRELIISQLGSMLEQATRASISKGALYDPGEPIDRNATNAWQQVAATLVNLVEVAVETHTHEGKDVQES